VNVHKSGARQIFSNLWALLSGKAAAGIIGLGYLVIAARMLGVTDYGVLNLVHGYVTLVGGIIAFSGWHGLVRYGAEAMHLGDHQRFLDLARLMSVIELSLGIIAVIAAALAAPLVGPRLGWSAQAVNFSLFYSFAIFATVRTTPHGILQIAERFDLIGLHQAVMPSARLIGALLVWAFDGGLIAFLWVWLLSALAEGLSMWIMGFWVLRRMRLDGQLAGPIRGITPANPGLLGFITATNADITLRELAPRAAPLILGWMLGPAAAGIYSLAQRASTVLQQPAQMLGQASYAVIAKLVAASNFAEARRAVWKSLRVAVAVSIPITLLLALFGEQLLGLLGGTEFKEGVGLLILIAVSRTITIGMPSLSAALTALGRPSSSIMVNLATNLGLLPLLPLFLHLIGLNGAGWHVILQSVAALALLVWCFRRESHAVEYRNRTSR